MITSKLAPWLFLAVTCLVPFTGLAQKKPRIVFITHGQTGDPFWDVVRKGADDGGEMGAFHFVLAPLREIDLRVRMQEYLPVGLEFGVIYQN